MKLSEIKKQLNTVEAVTFKLPDGGYVPSHFHVTEVGLVTKHFIDCGGTIRNEKAANFQLWSASDTNHRLTAEKLLKIITLSEKVLGNEDPEIEVEYQTDTIGKYGLQFDGQEFVLTAKHTACLAQDRCGTPHAKPKIKLSDLSVETACCSPNGGCC